MPHLKILFTSVVFSSAMMAFTTAALATPMDYQLSGPVTGTINLDFMAPNGAMSGLVGSYDLFHLGINYTSGNTNVVSQERVFIMVSPTESFDAILTVLGTSPLDALRLNFFGPDNNDSRSPPNSYNGFLIDGRPQLPFLNGAIAAVPEPTTLLLFGSGLAGLIGWRLRKNKTA